MEVHDRSEDRSIIRLSDLKPPKESPFAEMSRDEILDEAEISLDKARQKIVALKQNPAVNINRHELEIIARKVLVLCTRIISVEGQSFQRTLVIELSENITFILNLLNCINSDNAPFTMQSLKEIKGALERSRNALEESLKVDLPEVAETKGSVILALGWEK